MENSLGISVSFIGAGHVANHLASSFYTKGVIVQQIYNRSHKSGRDLSRLVSAQYISSLKDLKPSDYLIIAVNDNAVKTIADAIPKTLIKNTIIVHTSGSQSIEVLQKHRYYGGFYPLQSFRKALPIDIRTVPILISSKEEIVKKRLIQLGETISTKVTAISDADRSLIHLPAVMVNNFTNHLLQLAYDYCEKRNLDFTLLHPLINETVRRLENQKPPKEMQTGPAIRGDQNTINRHLTQLGDFSEIKQLYQFMSHHIEEYYE
ncbi:MAG: putative short-subunit dehydrogenase-like oxidoreductase (DUF2520 family) [Saprospiraceae bacterium]